MCNVWDEYKDHLEFSEAFVESIDAFDPLERPLSEDYNGISRDELVQKVEQLVPIDGTKLQLSLNDVEFKKLEEMFSVKLSKLHEQGTQFVDQMSSQDVSIQFKFDD